MPQAPALGAGLGRAVDSLSANNEKTLGANQRIRIADNGAVFIATTRENGSIVERRVDSSSDLDHTQKGGKVWWRKLLEEQKARDRAAEAPKKAAKKVTSDE